MTHSEGTALSHVIHLLYRTHDSYCLLFGQVTLYDSDYLLFSVTYCPSDFIVLVTSIVAVTLLFSSSISRDMDGVLCLRLDFLYHTVY